MNPLLADHVGPRTRKSGSVALVLCLACFGCTAGHALIGSGEAEHVRARLELRAASIKSAAYRVRWQAIGTDPHSEFILEIAYKAPGHYHIVATGPFGLPAFTAVADGEKFWFIDHQSQRYIHDSLANLGAYEIPMAEFFSGAWRDVFAGGWGGRIGRDAATDLMPGKKHGQLEGSGAYTKWFLLWNYGHDAPALAEAADPMDPHSVFLTIKFGKPRHEFPYWELQRMILRHLQAGGEHRWIVLKQEYNIALPDHLFRPLSRPRR